MSNPRTYRSVAINPGPPALHMCDDGVRRVMPDGWDAACPCGWTENRATQTLLRPVITNHRWTCGAKR